MYDVSLVVVWFLFTPLSDHLIMYYVGRQPDPTQFQDNDMLFTSDEDDVLVRLNGPIESNNNMMSDCDIQSFRRECKKLRFDRL